MGCELDGKIALLNSIPLSVSLLAGDNELERQPHSRRTKGNEVGAMGRRKGRLIVWLETVNFNSYKTLIIVKGDSTANMLTHLCRQTSILEFNCDYSTKLQHVPVAYSQLLQMLQPALTG